jgi:hypothetical protein
MSGRWGAVKTVESTSPSSFATPRRDLAVVLLHAESLCRRLACHVVCETWGPVLSLAVVRTVQPADRRSEFVSF